MVEVGDLSEGLLPPLLALTTVLLTNNVPHYSEKARACSSHVPGFTTSHLCSGKRATATFPFEMCGIHACLSQGAPAVLDSDHERRLCNRGPDYTGNIVECVRGTPDHPEAVFLSVTSTVLSLRGDLVTPQPFEDPALGLVMCWNGEAWSLSGTAVSGNDGAALFKLLRDASASSSFSSSSAPFREQSLLGVLRGIEGPFALVLLDKAAKRLYFARDRLGRRSLLMYRDKTNSRFSLSSVAASTDSGWQEVDADGLYVLNLGTPGLALFESSAAVTRLPWLEDPDAEFVSSLGRFTTLSSTKHPPLDNRSPSVDQLQTVLTNSLQRRVLHVPKPPSSSTEVDHRVAILFSGGLDCTVLARLCHDLLPAEQGIDLINVAFENPRVVASSLKDMKREHYDAYEACPDRNTGRKSLLELQKACHGRNFRFIAVNVPYAEAVAHREQVVSLMFPHRTEMDLSIAYALYFAARGEGLWQVGEGSAERCATPARILLSGLGADELFGGYVRHATAFVRGGYTDLVAELKLDVARIAKRNLGRDDRVMAHWGKEVRFPYLDEELVRWAIDLPVWDKCDFEHVSTAHGIEPGKRILRLVAEALGMMDVAREKKRAIQFGARTAKMESGKVKGTTLISV